MNSAISDYEKLANITVIFDINKRIIRELEPMNYSFIHSSMSTK